MNDATNPTGETITLNVHGAIGEIAPEAWDICAGDINPTLSHVFLNALEESGSVTARSGWASTSTRWTRRCTTPSGNGASRRCIGRSTSFAW